MAKANIRSYGWSLMQSFPVLCRYGRARTVEEMLNIPHWELMEFLEAVRVDRVEQNRERFLAIGAAVSGNEELLNEWDRISKLSEARGEGIGLTDEEIKQIEATGPTEAVKKKGLATLQKMAHMLGG